MRAKFSCNSVDENGMAHLSAVYGTDDKDNEENNQFAAATPYGVLEMQVDNPSVKDFLKPGKDYYLDFTEVN